MANWYEYLTNPKKALQGDIEELNKAEGITNSADSLPEAKVEEGSPGKDYGRKSLLTDPYWEQSQNYYLTKRKVSRLTNRTLKDVSLRDWLVSSIMQVRVDTMIRFARPQADKFDMGFRIVKKDKDASVTEEEQAEMKALESFIYNCGRLDKTPKEDKVLFGNFLKLIVRDALTFGHISVEKIFTRGGALHRFRPLPAESVYLIDKRATKGQLKRELEEAIRTYHQPKSDNDPRSGEQVNEQPVDYFKYIQVGDGNRTLAVFGDEDLIFKLFNPQNFMDMNGYCYSPLELAILNVTNHLNVENYNANFFTHGYAARGILHLKGTVTQSQLISFRRQFYNTINGSHNAWRTPIIAGLDDVDWVSMAGSAREMEYINFNNHLLRSICTQFQIDPIELGLDYLVSATGRAPAGSESNRDKITYSRERGLYPMLMFIEDMINQEIIPLIDKQYAEKYMFKFEGFTDDTPQTEAALLQAEMTIHKSMNDLLRAGRKETIEHPIADLPLNQTFWALIEKNMTKGEIREFFLGDKGATKKRELQYIPGDPMFVGWQQMVMTLDSQRLQQEMQQKQIEHQNQIEQEQHEMEKEKHSNELNAQRDQAAANAVNKSQDIKETAKEFGVGDKPLYVDGEPVANPINKSKSENE